MSDYKKPPGWRNNGRFYFTYTDPCSRHVRMIADQLRDRTNPATIALEDAGFEPEHWASSMEWTVMALWKSRKGNPLYLPELERALAKMAKKLPPTPER